MGDLSEGSGDNYNEPIYEEEPLLPEEEQPEPDCDEPECPECGNCDTDSSGDEPEEPEQPECIDDCPEPENKAECTPAPFVPEEPEVPEPAPEPVPEPEPECPSGNECPPACNNETDCPPAEEPSEPEKPDCPENEDGGNECPPKNPTECNSENPCPPNPSCPENSPNGEPCPEPEPEVPTPEKPKVELPKTCLCPEESCNPSNNCDECPTEESNDDDCQPKEAVCEWGDYCEWSECTKECGGRRIRSRKCNCPDGFSGEPDCVGEMFDFDEETCPQEPNCSADAVDYVAAEAASDQDMYENY